MQEPLSGKASDDEANVNVNVLMVTDREEILSFADMMNQYHVRVYFLYLSCRISQQQLVCIFLHIVAYFLIMDILIYFVGFSLVPASRPGSIHGID